MLWSGGSSWPINRTSAFLSTGSLGQPWSAPGHLSVSVSLPTPKPFYRIIFCRWCLAMRCPWWAGQLPARIPSSSFRSAPKTFTLWQVFSLWFTRVYVNSSRIYSNCEQVVNIEVFQNKEPVNLMQLKLSELPSTYGPLQTNFCRCPSPCPNILLFCSQGSFRLELHVGFPPCLNFSWSNSVGGALPSVNLQFSFGKLHS